jgi:hypothetical protein
LYKYLTSGRPYDLMIVDMSPMHKDISLFCFCLWIYSVSRIGKPCVQKRKLLQQRRREIIKACTRGEWQLCQTTRRSGARDGATVLAARVRQPPQDMSILRLQTQFTAPRSFGDKPHAHHHARHRKNGRGQSMRASSRRHDQEEQVL